MNYVSKPVLTGLIVLAMMGKAVAAEVVLQVRDTGEKFNAELVGFNGRAYTVNHKTFGRINLLIDKFTCIAGACPEMAGAVKHSYGIFGSNTIGSKLMPALIEAYAQNAELSTIKRPGKSQEESEFQLTDEQGEEVATINLHSYGSSTAFPALASGEALIGMSSRPIKNEEVALLSPIGIGGPKDSGFEQVLALDGLLIIVAPQNPLASISVADLARIFSGEVRDWSQLGLPSGPINLYARDQKSGTFDTFKSLVLKPALVDISPEATLFESNVELSDAVAADPRGIGFTGFAYKRKARSVAISTACGITQNPSVFNVKTEEYPLSRRLFVYTRPTLDERHASELINFLTTGKAQNVISKSGFINQAPERLPFGEQSERIAAAFNVPQESFNLTKMKQLVGDIKNFSRLSNTFRFRTNSSTLDTKAQGDITRLAKELTSDRFANSEVMLIGFTDSLGDFESNLSLSLERAASVRQSLVWSSGGRLNAERLNVRGYGELMPVNCNTDAIGRNQNRRVEIWIGGETGSGILEASSDPAPQPTSGVPVENEQSQILVDQFLEWHRDQIN